MKLPAIQFYPADWRKDPGVQSLDYFDKGVWFEILCLMHESPERGKLMLNGVAMPDAALARILGLDNQTLTKTLTTLLDYGVASRDVNSGALMNRRMVKDEEIRKIRTEAGKKGGNPALLNQKPTTQDKQTSTTGVKQKSTPSSSVSSSTTTSSTEKKEETPSGVAPQTTEDFTIWKLGVGKLMSSCGLSEQAAKGFISKQAKDYGKPAVAAAITQMLAQEAIEPRSYMIQVLKNGATNGTNKSPSYTTAAERRATGFRERLAVVEELRPESVGAVDEDVRGQSRIARR